MKIKKYNIKGKNWHEVKIFHNKGIVDITCDCTWSQTNKRAWKEGDTICKHIKIALNKFLVEQKYISRKWMAVKKEILARDKECDICSGKENLSIHHKIFARDEPEYFYEKENLVTLCNSCHTKLHNLERTYRNNHVKKSYGDLKKEIKTKRFK